LQKSYADISKEESFKKSCCFRVDPLLEIYENAEDLNVREHTRERKVIRSGDRILNPREKGRSVSRN